MTDVAAAPVVASPSVIVAEPHESEWTESLGAHWRLDLAVMAFIVFCFGAVRPLADPDLPMHLAVGEWIVRHHAVPFTEPFAWTRMGAPYYAYSWLPQTTFYLVLAQFGPLGLRALQGMLVLGSAVAAVFMARCAGWRPSIAVMMAGFNVIVAAFFVAMLRPQSILLITVPVIWGLCFHIVRGSRFWPTAVGLLLASALTANAHLFFALTLAPTALLWVHRPDKPWQSIAAVASVIAGWALTPYSPYWFDVLRHNFAPNILMRPPSAITELQPGFVSIISPSITPMFALVAAMLAVPWLLASATLARRERIMAAVYWSLGLIVFGFATRLFIAWWLLAVVPAGWALLELTRGTTEAAPRTRFRVLGLVACVAVLATEAIRTRDEYDLEGTTRTRTLPSYLALPAERIATWLEQRTVAGASGKVMTSFTYGSYLTWRLPRYSESIDSRGIFPDSVAAAEAVVLGADRDVPVGPWRSADLAILPVRFRAAAVLDTAPGWRRVATAVGAPVTADSTALWVRLDWWSRVRRDGSR